MEVESEKESFIFKGLATESLIMLHDYMDDTNWTFLLFVLNKGIHKGEGSVLEEWKKRGDQGSFV